MGTQTQSLRLRGSHKASKGVGSAARAASALPRWTCVAGGVWVPESSGRLLIVGGEGRSQERSLGEGDS